MKFRINENALSSKLCLPIDGLSDTAQEIITAFADTYQCSRDYITSCVFASVSTAVGKRIIVDDGKYHNYMSLFICLVGDSGSNKSTALREILQPLFEFNYENYEAYTRQLKAYEKREKAGDTDAEKPKFRQIVLTDSTPEARVAALQINPSLLLYSDELATMMGNFNRYNKSGEVSELLSLWSGDNLTVNRKGAEPIVIRKPFVNIVGSIQPDVLPSIFGNDFFKFSGLNARWLFVYPEPELPPPYSDRTIPSNIIACWHEYIRQILEADIDGNDTLYISGDAKKVYEDYYNRLQRNKVDADSYVRAIYSKLQIYVERLAGIVHLLGDNHNSPDITPEEMEYAIKCMDYFSGCAQKVYRDISRTHKQQQPITKEMAIALCCNSFDVKNKQAFADAIGVSRPFVSRAVSKHNMLRCYGYGSSLSTDSQQDTVE